MASSLITGDLAILGFRLRRPAPLMAGKCGWKLMNLYAPLARPPFQAPTKAGPTATADASALRTGAAVETAVEPAADGGASRFVVRHLESGRVLTRIPTPVEAPPAPQRPGARLVDLRV